MSPILEFKGISKSYKSARLPAVHAVDLQVHAGETLALLGESGSGKSTLLKLAAGLECPDQGEIILKGAPLVNASVWTPPEGRDIGLVFQDGALFPHLNVAANIAYGLPKMSRSAQRERIQELLTLVGLEDKEKRFPHELSGGERQRLAIVRSLAPQPQVLLLDEPFASLDPALRRALRSELRTLLKSLKATVILVTHDPEDTLHLADKVAIIRQGRIERHADTASVYRDPPNAYCAKLFGHANCISCDHGKVRWVRPEHIELKQPEDGGVRVKVLRITESCGPRQVWVRPLEAQFQAYKEEWCVNVPMGLSLNPGDEIGLVF